MVAGDRELVVVSAEVLVSWLAAIDGPVGEFYSIDPEG